MHRRPHVTPDNRAIVLTARSRMPVHRNSGLATSASSQHETVHASEQTHSSMTIIRIGSGQIGQNEMNSVPPTIRGCCHAVMRNKLSEALADPMGKNRMSARRIAI